MKTVLLFCFSIILNPLFAQDDIQYIRNIYQDVSKQIRDCLEPDLCSLYKTEVLINQDGNAWRGVGNYSKTITFWFTDDPINCDDCLDMGRGVLAKVIVEEIAGLYSYHYEYLYQEGKLIFHFLKDESEYRLYFSDDELIRYMEGPQITQDTSDRQSNALSEAEHYMQLFLMSF